MNCMQADAPWGCQVRLEDARAESSRHPVFSDGILERETTRGFAQSESRRTAGVPSWAGPMDLCTCQLTWLPIEVAPRV